MVQVTKEGQVPITQMVIIPGHGRGTNISPTNSGSEFSEILGVSSAEIAAVAATIDDRNGRWNIRAQMLTAGAEETLLALVVIIREGLMAYFGANLTEPTVLSMGETLVTEFGHIHVLEIEKAFSLCCAGKLAKPDGNPLDIRAYNGTMSVVQFCDILRGYDQYRRPILAALLRKEKETFEANRLRLTPRSEKFWEERLAYLKGLPKDLNEDTVKIVTEIDFKILEGQSKPTSPQKLQALAEAKKHYLSKIAMEMTVCNATRRNQLLKQRDRLKSESWKEWGEDEGAAIVVIAQRIMIIEWLSQM